MSLPINKLPRIVYIFFLSAFLALISCGETNTGTSAGTDTENFRRQDDLGMEQYINNYDSTSGNLDWAFYFDMSSPTPDTRVTSLRLDSSDKAQFFTLLNSTIAQVDSGHIDSMAIRIVMALLVREPPSSLLPPAFQPYLRLITYKNQDTSMLWPAFSMTAFKSTVQWDISLCNSNKYSQSEVQCTTAVPMIKKWQELEPGQITAQLYPDTSKTGKMNPGESKLTYEKVRYYTFGWADTQKINNLYQGSGETLHFYLHLGLHYAPDSIPLRTILHLDVKDLATEEFEVNESTYFEFAKPCPQYCDE